MLSKQQLNTKLTKIHKDLKWHDTISIFIILVQVTAKKKKKQQP